MVAQGKAGLEGRRNPRPGDLAAFEPELGRRIPSAIGYRADGAHVVLGVELLGALDASRLVQEI